MEDPKLNRIIEETRELHTRWGQFHEFFKMAMKAERIGPEAEAKFLDLKTRIAMLHDGFMQGLGSDQKVGQGVLAIISSCIMLRRIPLMSTAEAQKLELDWNEVYLLMTETIANLEDERERLSTVNATSYKIQQMKMHIRAKVAGIVQNGLFQLSLILFIIGFVVLGIPMLGIYDYRQIRTDFPLLAPVVNKVISIFTYFGVETELEDASDLHPLSLADMQAKDQIWRDIQSAPPSRDKATREYFASQLFSYGFLDTDIAKARGIIDNSKWAADGYKNFGNGQGVIMYVMLLPKISDAVNLVNLRKSGLAKRSKTEQDNINATILVCRKSNVVLFGISESKEMRETFLQQMYGFSDAQMHP